ncbi:MAG: MupG family TIM beta-alpha barrel fold protein [Erysipelotrichaceae bacterium]|nr:MupG family TIM beta-alpha barrel fold protein [Erysipelotrichaceae bacterium]MDY5252763.1 MupG family TIM beta-alpha barrel fold protein [Erysipelotrichaceae bacterium]
MIGISSYFQDLSYEYLKKCSELGARYVFTSLQIPEEDYSNIDKQLPNFIEMCFKLNLSLIPDVSPNTFDKLGLKNNDFGKLKEIGFKHIRLDYGFDDVNYIKNLTKDFTVMLNASVVDEQSIKKLIAAEVDLKKIIMTHNFYPKRFTGLSSETLKQKNETFKKYGLVIQAFVPGNKVRRFPLYEGLPTLEEHRDKSSYISAIDLLHNYHVDDIFIGDSQANVEEIRYIYEYQNKKKMHISVYLDDKYKYLMEKEYTVRKDHSKYNLRLVSPRLENIEVKNNISRCKGAITIDNKLMGRYCGEIQICLEDLPADARVNVIGFVSPYYLDLLKNIDNDTNIQFITL